MRAPPGIHGLDHRLQSFHDRRRAASSLSDRNKKRELVVPTSPPLLSVPLVILDAVEDLDKCARP